VTVVVRSDDVSIVIITGVIRFVKLLPILLKTTGAGPNHDRIQRPISKLASEKGLRAIDPIGGQIA
jgi:hypothetical protein